MPTLTRERFELELVKIKDSVSPGHRGPNAFMAVDGSRCIVGQLFYNLGAVNAVGQPRALTEGCPGSTEWWDAREVSSDVVMAMTQNDIGMTWHSIVDDYFARRSQQEGPPALTPTIHTFSKLGAIVNAIHAINKFSIS